MKRIILFLLLLGSKLFGQSTNEKFNDFLNIEQTVTATVAIQIENLSTGKQELSFQEEKLLYPASLQKLVTTGAALDLLSKDFRFNTIINLIGKQTDGTFKGILEIKASGDPSLDIDFVDEVYNFLKEKGINKLEGYIVVDESDFEKLPNQTWLVEDVANYYGSPAFGFNFLKNTYKLNFQQSAEGERPKIVSTNPYMRNLDFDNQVICKGKKDLAYIIGMPFSNERKIVGSIPAGTKTFTIKGAIDNPAQIFKNILIKKFQTENFGFVFNADIQSKNVVYSTKHESKKLEILLKEMNQKSNNLYAETLLKMLGLKINAYASSKNGIKAIENHFKNSKSFIYDGSGLSRKNMLSASFLMNVLKQYNNNTVFKNSLGVSGVSGTMKYLSSEKTKGKIKAKSGSADGVLNYAGYFKNAKGEDIAFVLLVNQYSGSRTSLRKEILKVLESFI